MLEGEPEGWAAIALAIGDRVRELAGRPHVSVTMVREIRRHFVGHRRSWRTLEALSVPLGLSSWMISMTAIPLGIQLVAHAVVMHTQCISSATKIGACNRSADAVQTMHSRCVSRNR